MTQATLEYRDLSDPQTRINYINNAPTPRQGYPVEPANDLPPIINSIIPPRPIQTPQQEVHSRIKKRKYLRITLAHRDELIRQYSLHADDWSPSNYASVVGISKEQVEKLLVKLRKGESIYPKDHFKKKSRTIPFQKLLVKAIHKDPTITINGMRELIAKEEIMRKQLSDIENDQEIHEIIEDLEVIELSMNGYELSEEEINEYCPSVESIRRFLKGETSEDLRNIPIFSFKRETRRGAIANTDENKQKRLDAVNKLRQYIANGAKWVAVDETSWSVAVNPAYGWGERGEKCFITKARGGLRLTSSSAIDNDGFSHCNLVCGNNSKETFNAYFKRLIAHYDELGRKCVFWCDNCNIHADMVELTRGTNHVVVFNAAYSPELNPIENIFGIWKNHAEKSIRTWNGIQDFIEKITASFKSIESEVFQKSFERVRNSIWYKVDQKQDL